MGEMLGNYHFQKRDFRSALAEFASLKSGTMSSATKNKLVICYVALNEVDKALEFLEAIIESDRNFLANTFSPDDAQLCMNLIYEYENCRPSDFDALTNHISLGILSLYCNLNKSLECFTKASQIDSSNKRIIKILRIISDKVNQLNDYSLS